MRARANRLILMADQLSALAVILDRIMLAEAKQLKDSHEAAAKRATSMG